ncbi:hypothetical protein C8F04DRAFT_1137132, partial [Mycena alexandri]
MDGHKALISPLRRLPLDTIQEMFLARIPTPRNSVMSASEAPVRAYLRLVEGHRTLYTPPLVAISY